MHLLYVFSIFLTDPNFIASPPSDAKATCLTPAPNNDFFISVTIEWSAPMATAGDLSHFYVKFNGSDIVTSMTRVVKEV